MAPRRPPAKKAAKRPGAPLPPPPNDAGVKAETEKSEPAPTENTDHIQDDSTSIPNTPSTKPSVTASASSPTAPQRLASLPHATPSTSITTPTSSRGGVSGGRPKIAAPRFTGRRSQTARAELEKAEIERRAKEAADAEVAKRKRGGGRGRGRGRGGEGGRSGGFRGRGGYVGEAVASGPFSAGRVNVDVDAGRGRTGGGTFFGQGRSTNAGAGATAVGRASSAVSSAKLSASTGAAASMAVKREGADVEMADRPIVPQDGGYISSDADESGQNGGQRQDIDELAKVIDLTRDDHQFDLASGFAPLRIPRQAHKERTLGLNVDSAATAEAVRNEVAAESGAQMTARKKGKQRAKDLEITGEQAMYQGAWSSSETDSEPKVKQEPLDDNDGIRLPMSVDSSARSPTETRRKARERVEPGNSDLAGASANSRVERPLYQTQDELDEWERHQHDLDVLRTELGTLALPVNSETAPSNAQPPHEPVRDRRAEKVYLFQFPPVLPELVPVHVKTDHDAASNTHGPAKDAESRKSNPRLMPDSTILDEQSTDQKNGHRSRPPAGVVGKLRVHRSGRTTLDWGGTALSVGMGSDVSFLQDLLVATLPDGKTDGSEEPARASGAAGVALAMGQVKGKFVVTPDWEGILG